MSDASGFGLRILGRAAKALEGLPPELYERIKGAVRMLAIDPYPRGSKKLVGRKGWRIRIGSYRVVYEIDKSRRMIIILDIGPRKDVY